MVNHVFSLEVLPAKKDVPDDESMVLDWVMLSHVDDDHANGLVQPHRPAGRDLRGAVICVEAELRANIRQKCRSQF